MQLEDPVLTLGNFKVSSRRFSTFPSKFISFEFNLDTSKDILILPLKSSCYEARINREKEKKKMLTEREKELFGEKVFSVFF